MGDIELNNVPHQRMLVLLTKNALGPAGIYRFFTVRQYIVET
jgi:hypothetical protein